MRSHGRFLRRGAPALATIMLACGCSLPGTFGVSTEPTPSPTKTGTPHPLVAPTRSANSTGPVTPPGPAPILPLNLAGPESPQDLISVQAQNLKTLEDDRKLLGTHMLQLEATLQDRDKALAEATDELNQTRDEIGRTRADIRRITQERDSLRERLDRTEKENIDLRKQIIKMMEREEQGGPPLEPVPGKP